MNKKEAYILIDIIQIIDKSKEITECCEPFGKDQCYDCPDNIRCNGIQNENDKKDCLIEFLKEKIIRLELDTALLTEEKREKLNQIYEENKDELLEN